MDKELIVVKGKVIEQQRSYSPNSGKDMSLEEAAKMVKQHHDQNPDLAIAHFIGINKVQEVLAQKGCVGLRIFHGVNNLGTNTIMIVGVDANGRNILTSTNNSKSKEIIMGGAKICPPYCDGTSTDDGNSTGWF